ncbi:MAG: SRPBCC family protein [Planctomycetota bacterium]|jgi:hypothetical protein
MTILWVLLALVVTLIVASQVIGHLLSERFEGRASADYGAGPEQVWEALSDVERHPMTGRMMKSVERLPDEGGLPCWVEDMGRGELITVKTVESERPRRLVREMSSARVDMTSRWEYELLGQGDACRLDLHGVTTIRGGGGMARTFRFMMLVGGGVKKSLVIQMRMLAATLGARERSSS